MSSFAFDASGKLKPSTPEALAEVDADTAVLAYTNGIADDGRPYYAYLAVTPSRYREFHAATAAREPMSLGDYGTIIAGGFEAEAPAEVTQMMRDLYGFDDAYEDKLKQELLKQQAAFLKAQEEKRIWDAVKRLKEKAGSD